LHVAGGNENNFLATHTFLSRSKCSNCDDETVLEAVNKLKICKKSGNEKNSPASASATAAEEEEEQTKDFFTLHKGECVSALSYHSHFIEIFLACSLSFTSSSMSTRRMQRNELNTQRNVWCIKRRKNAMAFCTEKCQRRNGKYNIHLQQHLTAVLSDEM
jgi:hypothetical protein